MTLSIYDHNTPNSAPKETIAIKLGIYTSRVISISK